MKESLVKSNIVKDIRVEGGYARRIEDRFAVGMPDLVLIPVRCCVIWAEAKIIRGNILRVTPRQFVELMRLRIEPHSTSFMIGWKDGVLFCAPPVSDGVPITQCCIQAPGENTGDLIRRTIITESQGKGELIYGTQSV